MRGSKENPGRGGSESQGLEVAKFVLQIITLLFVLAILGVAIATLVKSNHVENKVDKIWYWWWIASSSSSSTGTGAVQDQQLGSGSNDLASAASALQKLSVKLLTIGGGIGGVHTTFRAAKEFPGQVALIEATSQNCGIIRDTELLGSTSSQPLRFGSHALRVNLGTQVPVRTLFNELGIPLYYNGFKSRWQGYGRESDASYKQQFRAAWNLPNIPGGAFKSDPEYSALLYLLGPEQGNGVAINPITGKDDYAAGTHPVQQCSKFKDTYSMYRAYFGDAYAHFICSVNVGFLGDCWGSYDPCAYLQWYNREWNTADNGYPVGGFSEVCIRMRANATLNGAKFYNNEPALSVSTLPNGKFLVITPSLSITADDLILNLAPNEISRLSGNVSTQLNARPEIKAPKASPAVTIAAQFTTPWWISAGLFEGNQNFRLLQLGGGCMTRLEAHNNPYARLHNTIRVVYTDYQCLENWKSFLALPEADLTAELLRSLRAAFPGVSIPPPIKVFGDSESASWYYNAAGTPFSARQITDWARSPLGNSTRVCLANHAYRVVDSGWSVASVRTSAQCLERFYPAKFQNLVNNLETAYGSITPGWTGEVENPSPLGNEIFSWNSTTPVVWSFPPSSRVPTVISSSSTAVGSAAVVSQSTYDSDGLVVPVKPRPSGH